MATSSCCMYSSTVIRTAKGNKPWIIYAGQRPRSLTLSRYCFEEQCVALYRGSLAKTHKRLHWGWVRRFAYQLEKGGRDAWRVLLLFDQSRLVCYSKISLDRIGLQARPVHLIASYNPNNLEKGEKNDLPCACTGVPSQPSSAANQMAPD